MRRAVLLLAAAALVILFVQPASGAPEEKWARGTVSAIGPDSLTVKVKAETMTFTIDKTTQVVAPGGGTKTRQTQAMSGENPKLSDILKVGDNVEVRYTEADGKMLATMIRGGLSAGPMTSAEGAKHLEGVVSAVSGTSLTVKPKDGEAVTFTVDEKVRVTGKGLSTMTREKAAEGAKVVLTDTVAVGDTVDVTYKAMGTMNHASHVVVIKKGT